MKMATSSIFAGIKIDTPEAAEKFFKALDQAEEYARMHVRNVPKYRVGTEEDMQRRFGKKNEGV